MTRNTDNGHAGRRKRRTSAAGAQSDGDARALAQELQTHQAELEAQNEELRRVERELAFSRDRYRDLYDLAPVGYLACDVEAGVVREANLTAADMFGIEREDLLGRRFSSFVAADAQDEWFVFHRRVRNADARQHCELELHRQDGTPFTASVEGRCGSFIDHEQRCMFALIDRTRRKLAERDLDRLFELSLDMLAIAATGEGRWRRVNPAFCATLGWTEAELTGAPFFDLVHPADLPRTRRAAEEVSSGKPLRDFEHRLRCKDGSYKWITWNTMPYPAEGLLYCVGRDTTARREAAEALEIERNLLRTLIDQLPDFVYIKDAKCRFELVNLALARLMGATEPTEVRGKTDEDFYPADLAEEYRADEERVLRRGTPLINKDEPHVDGTGRRRAVLTTKLPLRDAGGNIVGLVGISRDVTDRRRAEQALRASEERYRSTFENTAIGMAHVAIDGRLLRVNQKFCEITGYGEQELTSRTFSDITHPEDYQVDATFARCLLMGDIPSYSMEKRCLRKDGATVWVRLTGSLLRDAAGAPLHFIAAIVDITARKRAEQRITELNATLEQRVAERTSELTDAYAQLESFTYSVSHDLRAPLRHIIGFLKLLRSALPEQLDPKAAGYLEDIRVASGRMADLIDDLLAFSRIGRADMASQEVDLNRLAQDAVRELEPDTAGREIDWRIGALPEATGDPDMLRQVLTNLLDNALKFTRTRETAVIEIAGRESPDEWTIFVRDNGVGFPQAQADKLFGLFQRLHKQDEFKGTGIGLANVRRIVQRHGGRTWAEGAPDQGATFYFTLPKHRPAAHASEAAPAEAET